MDESTLWGDFFIVMLKFVLVVAGFGFLILLVVFALATLATAIISFGRKHIAPPSETSDNESTDHVEVTPGT